MIFKPTIRIVKFSNGLYGIEKFFIWTYPIKEYLSRDGSNFHWWHTNEHIESYAQTNSIEAAYKRLAEYHEHRKIKRIKAVPVSDVELGVAEEKLAGGPHA